MRLIDADKLKIVNLGIGDYNIWGVEDCDINNAPTVKAIPLDKVEQIKNRLEKMPFYFGTTFHGETIKTVDVDKVIKMLDEAIKEQDE